MVTEPRQSVISLSSTQRERERERDPSHTKSPATSTHTHSQSLTEQLETDTAHIYAQRLSTRIHITNRRVFACGGINGLGSHVTQNDKSSFCRALGAPRHCFKQRPCTAVPSPEAKRAHAGCFPGLCSSSTPYQCSKSMFHLDSRGVSHSLQKVLMGTRVPKLGSQKSL